MKKIAKLVSVLLLAVLMAGLCGSAWAENTTEYMVRIYAGNRGTLAGGSKVIEKSDYHYNDTVVLPTVTVNDERYYVKGFREAGKDNSTYNTTSFAVKRDIDYVVAYGMKSTAVVYTVNYVSNTGATLFPPQTYYGNVNDKPVVAFRYFEGYQPQAYNLTKTLSKDPGENVFTFVYIPFESESSTVTIPGGNPGAVPGIPMGNGGGNAAPAQPEEIIDLDVPLAAPDEATTGQDSTGQDSTGQGTTVEPSAKPEAPKDTKLSSWIPYVLALGGVALLLAFLAALLKRRKPGEKLTREDLEEALKDAKKEVDESDKK